MSFKKDSAQLARINPYGGQGNMQQRARANNRQQEQRVKGGSGFSEPHWKSCYAPSMQKKDTIRFLRGDYQVAMTHDNETIVTETMNYVPFIEHHNGSRSSVCSAGPLWRSRKLRAPCPPCEIFWEDVMHRNQLKEAGQKNMPPKRMGLSERCAMSVYDYDPYFSVVDTDAQGAPRVNRQTQEPYRSWVKGDPNSPQFAGLTPEYGRVVPYSIPKTHFDTYLEWATEIGNSCAACGGMGTVDCTMKICGNPQCQHPIYDPHNCTLTLEQRKEIDLYPYACPHCQVTGFVNETIVCSNCANALRATLFDVDLSVQRTGGHGQPIVLTVFGYSPPRSIHVQDPEKLARIKPLDLTKKFKATPPDKAAQIFNLQVQPEHTTPPPITGYTG